MEIKIDHTSPMPLHAQVEELLRIVIEQPKYKAGSFLPKEIDLAKQLGISRNTLRQATNKLEYEGLLIRKKGLGTKVAEKSLITKLDNWHSFTQEMNEKGVAFTNYEISTNWIEANNKLATFFNIPENTKILKLTRLRGDKKGPFVYFESFFHPRIGLNLNDNFTTPLYELLETKYSTIVIVSKEKIKAKLASQITANRLKIKAGEPILLRERLVYGPGDRPVEYNTGHYIAEKFTYSIEIRK
jgi:GntR family transcriptional regulator